MPNRSSSVRMIERRSRGRAFIYFTGGKRVTHKGTLQWIRSLAIPPAWTDVQISSDRDARLLATGRDARQRKQYRYHPEWRARQERRKYIRILTFAEKLPQIRKKVSQDLKRRGLGKEKILAAIVRLLESTLIRVGNEKYARTNKSFGLTTFQDSHVRIKGSKLTFSFKGKSNKPHVIHLSDSVLASIVQDSKDIPGKQLFQYIDDSGERRTVSSLDVNDYLRRITGEDFTAKDFRTWAGTVLCALALREFEVFSSQAEAKRFIVRAIESVAKELGNTPAICRKSYIHPSICNAYVDGTLLKALQRQTLSEKRGVLSGLKKEEALVLGFLQGRFGQFSKKAKD